MLVYFDMTARPIAIPNRNIFNPDNGKFGLMGTAFTINNMLNNQKKFCGVSGNIKTPVIINAYMEAV